MAQLMPLPLTVSCFSKIQIGFTLLVLAHLGNPGKRAIKRVFVRSVLIQCFDAAGWPAGRASGTHTHPFNGPLSRTTRVRRYQKGTTNLDFTEARDSERQWHQLGHTQVCILLQIDNHASTPPLVFLQAGCPSFCLQCFDAVGWAAGRAPGL